MLTTVHWNCSLKYDDAKNHNKYIIYQPFQITTITYISTISNTTNTTNHTPHTTHHNRPTQHASTGNSNERPHSTKIIICYLNGIAISTAGMGKSILVELQPKSRTKWLFYIYMKERVGWGFLVNWTSCIGSGKTVPKHTEERFKEKKEWQLLLWKLWLNHKC